MNRLIFIFSLLLAMSASSVASTEILAELTLCKKITNSDDRLACFDSIKLPTASAKKVTTSQAKVPNQVEPEPAPVKPRVLTKQEFGLKNIIKEPEYISLTVKKVRKNAYGELTVYLQEGQVWKQSDGRALRLKPDDKIIIKTGSFNSFNMMKADGSRTMRVKRIK